MTLRVPVAEGIITLTAYISDEHGWGQELRALFANYRRVSLELRRQRPPLLDTPIWQRIFGPWNDIPSGDQKFDEAFFIVSETPVLAQQVLDDPKIRSLLLGLDDVDIEVRSTGALLPTGVDEIYASTLPMLSAWELETLVAVVESLLESFAELARGSDEVRNHIRVLTGPGGSFHDRHAVWEGDLPRMRAVDVLGETGDKRAFRPLLGTLEDPSPTLRVKAVRALGRLGDQRAVPALVGLLGRHGEESLAEHAAEALRALGQGALVDAFDAALVGNSSLLAQQTEHNEALSVALLAVLEGPDRAVHGHVFTVLAELGAVAALPVLRERVAKMTIPALEDTCRAAISELEKLQSLPRPAGAPSGRRDSLPRTASRRGSHSSGSLPRPGEATDRPDPEASG